MRALIVCPNKYVNDRDKINSNSSRAKEFINLSTTGVTNTHSIGNVLYTDYILLFQLSGMILLVAMIGAIVLTFRKRSGLKKQSYIKQISREKNDGVELVDVKNKAGVKIDA